MGGDIDPNVELLADVPVAGPEEDLFDRARVAQRLLELAIADPVTAPRMVALTGAVGAGKSSVLRILTAQLSTRAGSALITLDAASYAGAPAVMSALAGELQKLFAAAGVVETTDKVRNTLASYGSVVSSIARLAGVKVDVAGALERSADSLRKELAQNLEQIAKRVVIVIDHCDRLPAVEASGLLAALRMYASLPYLAVVIAVDRRALDAVAFERMVQVELALPPADRLLLARVMAGGLSRIATRTSRDLDPALSLFDPDGGLALDLIDTPRDAKRTINALAAALPLAPGDADVYAVCLELALRVLIPEIDGARLDARPRAPDRDALFAELSTKLTGHPRATAARAALRALIDL